jgi:hypothetical protein
MTSDRKSTNDGSTVQKGISEGMSDRNVNYKPSVPANYTPPPPIRVPPPPSRPNK